jgi:drug/metabolite transporter (DMT)-like permease
LLQPPTDERLRGITAMIAAVAVFSVMDALMKRLSFNYSPMQLSCMRCVASLVFLIVPVARNRNWATLRPGRLGLQVARAVLGIVMLGAFVYAVRHLSLAETYSVFLCAPLLIAALSGPMLGEHLPLRRWCAIAVGLGGVLIILRPAGSGLRSIAGVAAALSTVCYALSALTVRTLGRSNSNAAMVFWFLVLVGMGAGIAAIADWQPIAPGDWPWLAAIGLSGALGQYWITDAFRRAPPSVVAPFEYSAILWGFAIDWIFWSATPTWSLLTGAAVVISSGLYVIWDERRLATLALAAACPPP